MQEANVKMCKFENVKMKYMLNNLALRFPANTPKFKAFSNFQIFEFSH
jgi:hypothetical protein